MRVISDANLFSTLVEAIKLRAPAHATIVVEPRGDDAVSLAIGGRMLIRVSDAGRHIECLRHPLDRRQRVKLLAEEERLDRQRAREVVAEGHGLVRAALADAAINMLGIKVE